MLLKPQKNWIASKHGNQTVYFDPKSSMLATAYDDIEYPFYYIRSMMGVPVYTCLDCGAYPQIHITKAGKYFCHCPASFLAGGEDCDPGEEYDGIVLISENTPIFDTIEEAIKQWNKQQSLEDIRNILFKKIKSKEITNWKEIFDYLFEDDGRFRGWKSNQIQTCEILRRILGYLDLEDEFQMLEADDMTYKSVIESLCKTILRDGKTE